MGRLPHRRFLTAILLFGVSLIWALELQFPQIILSQVPPAPPFNISSTLSPVASTRLFITPEQLAQIRQAIQIPGSHHQQAFAALQTRVNQNDWRIYDSNTRDRNWNYARSWLAREAALLYQVTANRTYAQIAYTNLRAIYDDPDPDNPVMESGYGLARAMIGMGFAIAYDWAAPGWTIDQQQWVREKLILALDRWPTYTHANLAPPWGSNWVAVCRGAELVMLLATGEEGHRPDRFAALKDQLQQHLRIAYGPTGFTQEGNGYLAYSGGFLIPALYALRSIGDFSLEADFASKAFWKLALYSGTFATDQASLQFGVGGGGFDAEGWTSLLLASVPAEALPYYQFFYDRHRGILNPASADRKFDHRRAGTTWALLYYPIGSVGRDPTGYFPPALADNEKGAYFFRNRWQDANDTLVSFLGDFKTYPRAWNQVEAFSLGLLTQGTRFIAGPGKQRQSGAFSRLLVDRKLGRGATGKPDTFEPNDRGGYVIVDGGETYASLGLTQAKRHLLVDFAPEGSTILSLLDQLKANSFHLYTWQLNLGDPDIQVTPIQEAGLSAFLLQDRQNHQVKGWVVAPRNAVISGTHPLKIQALGMNLKIWVTLWAGSGKPPIAAPLPPFIRPSQLASNLMEINLDHIRLSYDAKADRITLHRPEKSGT